jgi:peptidoglycan/LPS O-acetylase OafA/YrhL
VGTLAAFDFRHNAIGFLRLFFAALVVLAHAYVLGGFGDDPLARWNHGYWDLGNLSVGGFFVLSGFLIARSAERVGDVRRYLRHRFLRIFPAFWVCLIVVAFAIGPLIALREHVSLGGYFGAQTDPPWRYVVMNAALPIRQHGIAGLLGHVPYRTAFDGSLWTLQFEFACYLGVAALAWLGGVQQRRAVPLVFFVLWVLVFGTVLALQRAPGPLGLVLDSNYHLVADLVAFFGAGVVAYLYREKIPVSHPAGILALVATALALGFPRATFVLWLALPIAVLWIATHLPLRDVDRHVDLSYGLYIYAFPLQQLCAVLGFFAAGLTVFTAVPLAGALGLAALSWFAIERPCLAAKDAPFFKQRFSLLPRKPTRP